MGVQRALLWGVGASSVGSDCNGAPPWRMFQVGAPTSRLHTRPGPSEPHPALQNTLPKTTRPRIAGEKRTWGRSLACPSSGGTPVLELWGAPSSGTPARQSGPSPVAGATGRDFPSLVAETCGDAHGVSLLVVG